MSVLKCMRACMCAYPHSSAHCHSSHLDHITAHKQIFRLHVSVEKAVFVHICESAQYLIHDVFYSLFGEKFLAILLVVCESERSKAEAEEADADTQRVIRNRMQRASVAPHCSSLPPSPLLLLFLSSHLRHLIHILL